MSVSQGNPEFVNLATAEHSTSRGYPVPMSAAPTATPGTEVDEETLRRLIPPYRVILHNDDHNSMDHVILTLLRCVPSLGPEDAEQIMWTAHTHGQATVIECPRETAEHYRNCLESAGLTATIEPA